MPKPHDHHADASIVSLWATICLPDSGIAHPRIHGVPMSFGGHTVSPEALPPISSTTSSRVFAKDQCSTTTRCGIHERARSDILSERSNEQETNTPCHVTASNRPQSTTHSHPILVRLRRCRATFHSHLILVRARRCRATFHSHPILVRPRRCRATFHSHPILMRPRRCRATGCRIALCYALPSSLRVGMMLP